MGRIQCLLVISLLVGCSGKQPYSPAFREFELTYNDTWNSYFSIKFTSGDSVYVRQHWYSIRKKSSVGLKERRIYFGVLNRNDKLLLDSIITSTKFMQYDGSYTDYALSDGTFFDFYLRTDSLTKTIRMYGDSVPPALLRLGRWIADTKERLTLNPIDTNIIFHSYRPLPPLNVDVRKFIPPPTTGKP